MYSARFRRDLPRTQRLAGRAGFVVENAWLLGRHQRRAEEMQRALLPSLPARIAGIDLAGIYTPADDLSQVGGDWYDAFALPDGSVAVVIGDVVGHDLRAAGRMGAVRHKLRAIATDRMVLSPGHRVWIQSAHRAISFGALSFLIIHIVTEILAQRVVVFNQGRIIAEGAPRAVVNDPRVVEAYLGRSLTRKRPA